MKFPVERSNTIQFSRRKASSPAFKPLYDEGMGLVEETATYLDGRGRKQAKTLDRTATGLYAAESMRLTTRLMQIASWLLLQRALNAGEMTQEQVEEERCKIRLDSVPSTISQEDWASLPPQFVELVARSLRLQKRVQCMDADIYGKSLDIEAETRDNPVTAQINLLKTAFAAR